MNITKKPTEDRKTKALRLLQSKGICKHPDFVATNQVMFGKDPNIATISMRPIKAGDLRSAVCTINLTNQTGVVTVSSSAVNNQSIVINPPPTTPLVSNSSNIRPPQNIQYMQQNTMVVQPVQVLQTQQSQALQTQQVQAIQVPQDTNPTFAVYPITIPQTSFPPRWTPPQTTMPPMPENATPWWLWLIFAFLFIAIIGGVIYSFSAGK
jgi:hypothetical protein